jgi:hypothetical protein
LPRRMHLRGAKSGLGTVEAAQKTDQEGDILIEKLRNDFGINAQRISHALLEIAPTLR